MTQGWGGHGRGATALVLSGCVSTERMNMLYLPLQVSDMNEHACMFFARKGYQHFPSTLFGGVSLHPVHSM